MRIMILANFDLGLYKFRKNLIQELLKDNEVIISLPYGELVEPLKEMGCKFIDTPVDRRGINPITDLKLFFNYRKILMQENPDLVITYTIKPNVYGGFVCRLLKIPYAVNITGLGTAFENGGILKQFVRLLNMLACKNAKVVFFENEQNRQTFVKEHIVKESQTYRLNGAGVDLEKFKVAEYPKGEKTKFLFIGRVMAEKGINELFIALKKLLADGFNCELDILGSFEEDYKEEINKYEQEGWLNYLGYQKDVRPFIKACHCFVLPSWHEGMANTNLECAAMGRPIITSNIPGCMEAVENGVSGFLAKRKDAESLYAAMKKFLQLSNDERREMGLVGRQHMERNFDKTDVTKTTIEQLMA